MKNKPFVILLFSFILVTSAQAQQSLDAMVDREVATLVSTYKMLHAAPELSFKEIETAHYIAERLDALGVDKMTKGVGGTGVVADIRGERPGRAVLVRADMDGLPLTET